MQFKVRGTFLSALFLAAYWSTSPQAAAAAAFPALNDTTIRNAAAAWCTNPINAAASYGPIRTWNTSLVTDMKSLFDSDFYSSSAFNEDLSQWDTSRVTTMNYMFYGASAFNGNVSSWDTSKVKSMGGMYYGASSFNGRWNSVILVHVFSFLL